MFSRITLSISLLLFVFVATATENDKKKSTNSSNEKVVVKTVQAQPTSTPSKTVKVAEDENKLNAIVTSTTVETTYKPAFEPKKIKLRTTKLD